MLCVLARLLQRELLLCMHRLRCRQILGGKELELRRVRCGHVFEHERGFLYHMRGRHL